jgi:demethoxyubiquinone hydroxylase (CLK1/Coq7/Cat5 family)
MDTELHRRQLISILQSAYSGELAAALAYRSHWKSLKNLSERKHVREIEHDEWVHRRRVGEMLKDLKASPSRLREAKMWAIGRTVGLSCYLLGWFIPMYFAGRLEGENVEEYFSAARHARALRLFNFERDLIHMARVERQHEDFFFSLVQAHRALTLAARFFKWGRASGIETIPAGRLPAKKS